MKHGALIVLLALLGVGRGASAQPRPTTARPDAPVVALRRLGPPMKLAQVDYRRMILRRPASWPRPEALLTSAARPLPTFRTAPVEESSTALPPRPLPQSRPYLRRLVRPGMGLNRDMILRRQSISPRSMQLLLDEALVGPPPL